MSAEDTPQGVDGLQIRGLAQRQEQQLKQERDDIQGRNGASQIDRVISGLDGAAASEDGEVSEHDDSDGRHHERRDAHYHGREDYNHGERGPAQYGYDEARGHNDREHDRHDRGRGHRGHGQSGRRYYAHDDVRQDILTLDYDEPTQWSDYEIDLFGTNVTRKGGFRGRGSGPRNRAGDRTVDPEYDASRGQGDRSYLRDDRYYGDRYEDQEPSSDWRADQNAATHHESPPQPPIAPFDLIGTRGVSTTVPSERLLIRNIGQADEEMLAEGAKQLLKVTEVRPAGSKLMSTHVSLGDGARSGSINRVFVMREKANGGLVGFGYLQFMSARDATAAKNKWDYYSDPNHPEHYDPSRFRIGHNRFQLSYLNPNVLVPAPEDAKLPHYLLHTKDASVKLCWYDGLLYASELQIAPMPLASSGAKAEAAGQAGSSVTETKPKSKKRKAEAGAVPSVKKLAVFSRWGAATGQLEGDGSTKEPSNKEITTDSKGDVSQAESAPSSYADHERLCCLLCRVKLPDAATLNAHERVSDLHQTNLKDPQRVAKAIKALKKAGIIVDAVSDDKNKPAENASAEKELPSGSAQEQHQEYRDRAAERRVVNNQPKKPSRKANDQADLAAAQLDGTSSPPPQDTAASKLMKKMGWLEGSGLGASGSGMVGPIETNLYAAGVGLGAEGGKVGDAVEAAARATRGNFDEYLQKAKDTARERYMNSE